MWQAITDIIKSQPLVAILLVIITVALIFSGQLKVNTKIIKIGHTIDKEREILQKQLEWLHTYCSSRLGPLQAFAASHNVDFSAQDPHGLIAKYICERVYDICIQWAVLNHVRKDESYVKLKKDEIWELVIMLRPHPVYLTDDFRKELNSWTEEVINRLISIREVAG